MALNTTEVIFFKVKNEVKPEDPANLQGEGLLKLFRATQQQSSHHSSAWGRTVEDPNTLVWVIDWTDARGSTNPTLLQPFLEQDKPLLAIYTIFNPPISSSSSDTLTKNPVTELCFLPFPSDMSASDTRQLHADLLNFRTALVDQLPEAARPRSWTMGRVDRPSTVAHDQSSSGHAIVYLLAVGWETVEAHKAAKETQEFVAGITPIRGKMLPPVPGLEMRHVRFRKV